MRSAAVATVALLAACNFTLPGGTGNNTVDAASTDGPPNVTDTRPPTDTACADSDNDTVCDTADKCPGSDDRIDGDGDGTPDGCDSWLCGTEPGAPGNTVFFGAGLTNLANIDFAGEGDQTAVVAAGTTVDLDYDFGLLYTCGQQASCREQIEIGFAGVSRLGCLLDSTQVDNTFLASLNRHNTLPVPSAPGVYDLRVKVAANASGCGTSDQFTGGDPPANQTIAIVCVPP